MRRLMVAVLAIATGFASLMFASGPLAGAVVALTLGMLAVAVLGVIYRAGAARASWLGFALFGWGYMVLSSAAWWDRAPSRPALVTTAILEQLFPVLRPDRNWADTPRVLSRLLGDPDPRSALIMTKLDAPISMNFAHETPLKDILKYVQAATQGPTDAGIPIYIDPVGLMEVEKSMTSTVHLDLEGVPLRTTLALLLRQLGLRYEVRGGLLTITNGPGAEEAVLSFIRIGHCYWALLAGCIGALAGRYFYSTRDLVTREVP